MSDDLVKQLRTDAEAYRQSLAAPTSHDMFTLAYQWQDKKHRHVWDLCDRLETAADRIEKLEAEVGRLVKSRNKWGKLYNQTLEKLRLSVMSDNEYVKIIDEKCAEQADRIEKLEAALDDMAQFVSQEDWDCFLKPETRKALEKKDD